MPLTPNGSPKTAGRDLPHHAEERIREVGGASVVERHVVGETIGLERGHHAHAARAGVEAEHVASVEGRVEATARHEQPTVGSKLDAGGEPATGQRQVGERRQGVRPIDLRDLAAHRNVEVAMSVDRYRLGKLAERGI
jgi:hypothetical protein